MCKIKFLCNLPDCRALCASNTDNLEQFYGGCTIFSKLPEFTLLRIPWILNRAFHKQTILAIMTVLASEETKYLGMKCYTSQP